MLTIPRLSKRMETIMNADHDKYYRGVKNEKVLKLIMDYDRDNGEYSCLETSMYWTLAAAFYVYNFFYFQEYTEIYMKPNIAKKHISTTTSLLTGQIMENNDKTFSNFIDGIIEWKEFLLVYVMISILLQTLRIKNQFTIQALFMVVSLTVIVGPIYISFLLIYILVSFRMTKLNNVWSKITIWILGCLILIFQSLGSSSIFSALSSLNSLKTDACSTLFIMQFVLQIVLKTISFCIDMLNAKEGDKQCDFVDLQVYAFNFPTVFMGCHTNHKEFEKQTEANKMTLAFKLRNCIRIIMSLAVFYVIHEYTISNVYFMGLFRNHLSEFNVIHTLGLLLIVYQDFWIRSMLIFGVGALLATIDGIETDFRPWSIFQVFDLQSCWKNLNPGLYSFLKRYTFLSLIDKDQPNFVNKIKARFISFVFFVIFTGIRGQVVIYANLANTFMFMKEFLAEKCNNKDVIKFEETLSDSWKRRFHILLYVLPTFIFTLYACCVILTGTHPASVMMSKLFQSNETFYITSICIYVFLQIMTPLKKNKN